MKNIHLLIQVSLCTFLILISLIASGQINSCKKQQIKLIDPAFSSEDPYISGKIILSFNARFKFSYNLINSVSKLRNDKNVSTEDGYYFYAVMKDRKGAIVNDTDASRTFFSIIPRNDNDEFFTSVQVNYEDIKLRNLKEHQYRSKVRLIIKASDPANACISKTIWSKRILIYNKKPELPIHCKMDNFRMKKDTVVKNIKGIIFSFDCQRIGFIRDSASIAGNKKYTFVAILRDTTGRIVFNSQSYQFTSISEAQCMKPADSAKCIRLLIPYSFIMVNSGQRRLSAEINVIEGNGYLPDFKPVKTFVLKINQPEILQVTLSYSNLSINPKVWDNYFLGQGLPDPYQDILLNGNVLSETQSISNSLTMPNFLNTYSVLDGDTICWELWDDDGVIKRIFKNDDFIGCRKFKISQSSDFGNMDNQKFDDISHMDILLDIKKATFNISGPVEN